VRRSVSLRPSLAVLRSLVEDRTQGVFERGVVNEFLEESLGGGDLLKIPREIAIVTEICEGSEDLHESLGGAVPEKWFDGGVFSDVFPKLEHLVAILVGVIHIGIVEEGGQVVFLAAHAKSLKVDHKCLAVLEEEILRLEIAVNHVGRGGAEALAKSGQGGVVAESFRVFSKMSADVVLEEVILLPMVKWFVENRLEFEVLWWASVKKCVELLKGGTVKGLTVLEGTVLHREEVGIAQILDEGNLTADIVIKNFWDVQPGSGKEIRDR